jgi:hypothetical protein
MAKNKNFKNNKQNQVHPDFQNFQKSIEKEKLNEKEVQVGDKTYVIKKWKHTDTLAMLPAFANLLYVPIAALAADKGEELEGNYIDNATTAGDMVGILFHRLAEIEIVEFIKEMLNQVYIKGKSKPIDIDEDVDNPVHLIDLMVEVANANFLIGLCQGMYSSTLLMVAAQKVNQNLTSQSKQ